MKTTTLRKIREHSPCQSGWEKLLKHLGKTKADDEPLPFSVILDSNGLADALWCCRAAPEYAKDWRLFAIWCARQVEHLMADERSRNALNVAEAYANGGATREELKLARAAAWDAAWDAGDAAAEATRAAWAAADAIAWDVGDMWADAWAAARAAARAEAAAGSAAREAQTTKFLEIIGKSVFAKGAPAKNTQHVFVRALSLLKEWILCGSKRGLKKT